MKEQYTAKMNVFLENSPFKEQVNAYADRFIAPVEALREKQLAAKALAINFSRAPGQISQFLMFCNRLFYGAVTKDYSGDTLTAFAQALFDSCLSMYKWQLPDQQCAEAIAAEIFSVTITLPE
jgi:hypothetical protein